MSVSGLPAYVPSSACGRGCLPRRGAAVRTAWPIRAARLTVVIGLLVGAAGLAASMGLLTASGRTRLIRGWCRALLRACGVRLVVRGAARLATRPDPPGTLITANHVSWLDIPAVLAVEPVRVLAKSDVRGWPIVGRLTARAGAIFIDRRRLLRLPATVAEIAMALERGYSVLAFPEGSTWCGRTQGRFHPAVFQAAIDAGGAVRPLALRYTLADGTPTTLAAFVGDDTLFRSVWRVVTTRGLVVEVEIGPALQACDVSRRALATQSAGMVKQLATAGRRSAEVDGVAERARAQAAHGPR